MSMSSFVSIIRIMLSPAHRNSLSCFNILCRKISRGLLFSHRSLKYLQCCDAIVVSPPFSNLNTGSWYGHTGTTRVPFVPLPCICIHVHCSRPLLSVPLFDTCAAASSRDIIAFPPSWLRSMFSCLFDDGRSIYGLRCSLTTGSPCTSTC